MRVGTADYLLRERGIGRGTIPRRVECHRGARACVFGLARAKRNDRGEDFLAVGLAEVLST